MSVQCMRSRLQTKYVRCIRDIGDWVNGIDLRIDNAIASVEMEGMHVTETDRIILRRCARGEISYDQAVESIILGREA